MEHKGSHGTCRCRSMDSEHHRKRLDSDSHLVKLKKLFNLILAEKSMVNELPTEIQSTKNAFNLIDRNRDGKINHRELYRFLVQCQVPKTEEEVEEMIKAGDVNG